MLHILHCPLSGPDLTYISLLIIFCIIEYVTNKKTLNLAMKERVKEEIDRLEEANMISPVKFSEWAAPVVHVIKKDL